jgi:hypothetical protein
LKKIEEGLGGEAVGVVAVGHDAAVEAAPAEALDLIMGEEEGFLEKRFPVLLRQGPQVWNGAHHRCERARFRPSS